MAGKHVVLAFPQTYMNLSGEAVAKLVRRHSIDDPQQIVIVHDELDLPVGRMRVKVGGGLAGHNGLKSIVQHLKTDDFVRVRLGVGKPPTQAARRRPRAEQAVEERSHRVRRRGAGGRGRGRDDRGGRSRRSHEPLQLTIL